jgi:lipoprotein-anchoring transpeptidase ErfK/SrfK
MLTRRHFIQTTTALFSGAIATPLMARTRPSAAEKAAWDAQVTPAGFDPATSNPWGVHPRFLPQRVVANDNLRVGDIHVDAVARYIYHIEEGGTAMRYGVAIARGNLYEPGTYTIKRKVQWPHWTPTQNMIKRDPELYAGLEDGVPPGRKTPSARGHFTSLKGTATPICASTAPRSHKALGAGQAQAVCG